MTVNSEIIYEQPLNERVRTFLRIAHLFRQSEHYMSGHSEWDIRCVIDSLLDINDLLSRTDIKNEIIKELERHASTLKALKKNPGVDMNRLDLILGDISESIEELRDNSCQPGQILRQDELINSVKQRNAILGGSCNFDIPAYHYWLNRPPDLLISRLAEWQQDLRIIKRSIYLIINLIRNSSNPTIEKAEKGFFQKSLEQNIGCQLIRIIMSNDAVYFPEISAGKHRFTIRFMVQEDTTERPVQTDDDLEFQLHCCIL